MKAPGDAIGAERRIRLGSLFGPSYIDSYAQAWKELLPNASKLALPILYLQRHTFELLVKELLAGTLWVRSELQTLDDIFGTAESSGPVEPEDFRLAHGTHSFGELFPCLEKNLAALGRPSLPEPFHRARKLFFDVDEDQPDRLRYETVHARKKRTTQRSFFTGLEDVPPKYAPCHDVGPLLDEILLARSLALSAVVDKKNLPPTTILVEFYTAAWESEQEWAVEALSHLNPLTAATRDGSIKWSFVESTRLNLKEHSSLKDVTSDLANICLETHVDGRTLTIVVFKDKNGGFTWGGSAYFFAARRPNDTLTSGISPDECQSNLIYEIQEAFKRDQAACSKP